jgi:PAS domain S-box-containing protein
MGVSDKKSVMKKIESKLSISGIGHEKLNDPYEVIYADPRDEEIHLNFLKRAQINAHMARWFLDHEYNQLLWSDGIFEILEINPRKNGANFDNFLEVVHPDDRLIKNQVQEDLKTNKRPIEINYRLLFNDGRIKWINEICSTDFDSEGNPIRSYGTIQDITKYKLAEENFRQKEEQFKSLIESIPLLVAIIQNDRFEFINRAGSRMLEENTQRQVKGMRIAKIIPQKSRKNFNKKIKAVIHGQIESTFEEKMLRMNGCEFDVQVKLIRTTHNGSPAIQMIVNDITSRKKAEEALNAIEERFQRLTVNLSEKENRLKELIETKNKFFSIIAHDLRSPFSSIIEFLEILLNQYEEFNDDERKNYLSLIEDDANRTLNLLDDLLEWSKVQTGTIPFQPQQQKLLPIIDYVSKNLDSAIYLKQLKLNYAIPDEFEIFADKKMLTTIFQNLISNAIKYSNPHGIITISAHSLNDQNEIMIADNGIGMNAETKNKLFLINHQGSTPGTANEKGSGLGLILCKDFIEKHNGKIWIESELGIGSKFFFTLPNSFQP